MQHTQTHKQTQAKFLANDPSKAIQEMMDTIDSLRSVYERETEALDGANTDHFLSIQDEKAEIAQKYQFGIEDLLNRGDEIKTVNPMMKRKLEVLQQEFGALAKKNTEALSRMNTCIDRLGDTLRSAARNAAREERAFSYGENGQFQIDSKRPISTGHSETA